MPALLEEALASRPDVRAAELGIEAAAARLGWERSRVVAVTAVYDCERPGHRRVRVGARRRRRSSALRPQPGGPWRAPRPRSGGRAASTWRHASASPPSCAMPPRSSSRQSTALAGWRDTVLVPLEEQVQVANRAFVDGDVAYPVRARDAKTTHRGHDSEHAKPRPISPARSRGLSVRSGAGAAPPEGRLPVVFSGWYHCVRVSRSYLCCAHWRQAAAATRLPAAPPAKPATVTAPVKEAQLTTVTLTPDAEKRLAVVTAPVERTHGAADAHAWR